MRVFEGGEERYFSFRVFQLRKFGFQVSVLSIREGVLWSWFLLVSVVITEIKNIVFVYGGFDDRQVGGGMGLVNQEVQGQLYGSMFSLFQLFRIGLWVGFMGDFFRESRVLFVRNEILGQRRRFVDCVGTFFFCEVGGVGRGRV